MGPGAEKNRKDGSSEAREKKTYRGTSRQVDERCCRWWGVAARGEGGRMFGRVHL